MTPIHIDVDLDRIHTLYIIFNKRANLHVNIQGREAQFQQIIKRKNLNLLMILF